MRRTLLIACLLSLAGCDGRGPARVGARVDVLPRPAASDSAFAALVERLSEPGGYFDTDNLISNEGSYLQVVEALHRLGVRGGAYIGVGPDQNFSYIAQVRPVIAFVIDIRRDNLLEHLMFKALFELSHNRVEYLSLLHGRSPPDELPTWDQRDISEIVAYIDDSRPDAAYAGEAIDRVAERAARFGVPLSPGDLETIRRFHSEFIRDGLDLRFRSFGRRPRPYYPTYRQLVLETDRGGRRASYLADEADFRFVKSMEAKNLIIPVVGDLAGEHALAAIGREVAERGLFVSAFYTSNVEDYLMRGGTFERYVRNIAALPRDSSSVIIRSFFGRNFGFVHPQALPGYYSVQLLQTIESLLQAQARGGYRGYFDLVTRDVLEPVAGQRPGGDG